MASVIERAQGYLRKLLMPLGVDFYLRMDDRRVLENIILPYFWDLDDINNVLFVGCDWYTRGYKKFFRGKSYWTMDINPDQSGFGARRHIVDSVTRVADHFRQGQLDLIICNGVLGFGLNDLNEFDLAIRGCFDCLRDGGVFILGWDDNDNRRPFPLESSRSLAQFDRFSFPPLGTDHFLTANPGRHTYYFYRRQDRRP
jgi:SAM-dependent methyltransferase